MKATMTAINPPHTTNIFARKKIIEWRTFPMPLGTHYVYETKKRFGKGMVIGTIEIVRNYSFNSVDEIPDYLIEAGYVDRDFLAAYANGRKLYANYLLNPQLFDAPKRITCFTSLKKKQLITQPPQSYMYIDVDEKEKK